MLNYLNVVKFRINTEMLTILTDLFNQGHPIFEGYHQLHPDTLKLGSITNYKVKQRKIRIINEHNVNHQNILNI